MADDKIIDSGSAPVAAEPLSAVDEAKLLRKIDMRVLPILFLIYVAAFLDRYILLGSVMIMDN